MSAFDRFARDDISTANQRISDLAAKATADRSDLTKLLGSLVPNDKLNLTATAGLGDLAFALLDAAGFLGMGVTKDGVLAGSRIRALTSILTPLLSIAGKGKVEFDSSGEIAFKGDGTFSSFGGMKVKMQGMNYDACICDTNGNVLIGLMGGKLYGLGGSSTAGGFKTTRQTFANNVAIESGIHSYDFCIADANNNVLVGWKDGKLYGLRSVAQMYSGRDKLTITMANGVVLDFSNHNYDVAVADTNGNVLTGWMAGAYYGPSGAVSTVDLDTQDALNKARAAAVYQTRVTTVQKPTAAYNALYLYGQSLGQGDETWPAISRAAITGTYMLGGNTLSSADGGTFVQFSPTGLQPLVAQTVNGSTQYDATGEAALAPGNGSRGEPPNLGWARGAKLRLNDYLLVESDITRSLVTINVAKSGATIGELEKNHTEGGTEYYGKYSGSLTQLGTAVGASSCVVAGIMYMQGEHDYFQASGHTSLNMTYAAYKAKLTNLAATMQADAVSARGQSKAPAFFIYQTGAAYTRDVDSNGTPGMHIGMAQLDFALTAPNAWMVGPVYPYTDKGGHLDSNGARWFGHQIAKVWQRVVIEGRDWEPLRPIRIWKEGTNVIYISYLVPFGPLVFDTPQLSGGTEYNNASKGFRLSDDAGAVGVSAVEIVHDTIIKITCARSLSTSPYVWYASQGTTGNGMVRDSDPALASDSYVYEPERGMYTTANIPKFVNKPYPLWNWSVGFFLPVGYQE